MTEIETVETTTEVYIVLEFVQNTSHFIATLQLVHVERPMAINYKITPKGLTDPF